MQHRGLNLQPRDAVPGAGHFRWESLAFRHMSLSLPFTCAMHYAATGQKHVRITDDPADRKQAEHIELLCVAPLIIEVVHV